MDNITAFAAFSSPLLRINLYKKYNINTITILIDYVRIDFNNGNSILILYQNFENLPIELFEVLYL